MDKELLKTLKELNKTLKNYNAKQTDYIKDKLKEAFKEPATISIKKEANGRAETHVEGSALAILITLAGLENAILDKLDAPAGLFETIKETVGTREAK